ncbi:MAG: peptide chain release factor N(5)-glutamine methyltransferase, partial [Acidimicrobiales bacterium]
RDHDPYEALISGPTGLEAVEIVVAGAPALLRPGGALVVEIAPSQADSALALARLAGASEVAVEQDLGGRPRVLCARW